MTRASNVIARNARASAAAEIWRSRAREMRLSGHRLSEIAKAVGHDGGTVWRAIADIPFAIQKAGSGDVIRVPPWVRRADLVEDFRDVARSLGEHEAAAHCRRLTAAMRAPA